MKKPWVNLAVFETETDARKLDAFLQEKKFESRTYNDRLLQLMLFLCPPHATYRVQVRANDAKTAHHFVLHDPDAERLLRPCLHCPSCGSLHVQYPQMTRRFVLPTILLHLGIIFRIIEHEAYCDHCHFIWHIEASPIPQPAAAGAHHKP